MHHKHNGTAIITALFIMAIVAIAATAMSMRLSIDIQRSALTLTSQRLTGLASGVNAWAQQQLLASLKKPNDGLPLTMTPQLYAGAEVSGQLDDLQARFNLNNLRLTDKPDDNNYYQTAFARLLEIVAPGKFSHEVAKQLTANVVSWLSPNAAAIEQSYLKLNPPYRAAHQLMVSASELRLVAGFNAERYLVLAPFITALPAISTPINLNTASAEVLTTLGAGLSLAQAKAIVAARKAQHGFNSLAEFNQSAIGKSIHIPSNEITFKSQFFSSQAWVKQGRQEFMLTTTYLRQTQPPSIQVLWQSLGDFY